MRAVKPIDNSSIDPSLFGALLGYTSLFGIFDLHSENLVPTELGLQAIDAEVVFGKMVLPHEGLLLPFKEIDWERSGASYLSADAKTLTLEATKGILAGFISLCSFIQKHSENIRGALNEMDLHHYPVRVIFRNTALYNQPEALRQALVPLMPEEEIQLRRGDIPYFFKYMGSPDVYFIKNEHMHEQKVQLAPQFRRAADRIGIAPDILLGNERLNHTFIATSILYLARTLLVDHQNESIDLPNARLHIDSHSIRFEMGGQNFRAVRKRNVEFPPMCTT